MGRVGHQVRPTDAGAKAGKGGPGEAVVREAANPDRDPTDLSVQVCGSYVLCVIFVEQGVPLFARWCIKTLRSGAISL